MKICFDENKQEATARLSASPFPVFHAFWWRRIIIDEFHESAAWDFRNRELVNGIGATYRWGLSGTPPLDTSSTVTDIARLLWYHKSVNAPAMKLWLQLEPIGANKNESFIARHGMELDAEALMFLTNCVRQNSTKLVDAIDVEHHVEYPSLSILIVILR